MIAQHKNIEKFTATQYDKLKESYQNNVVKCFMFSLDCMLLLFSVVLQL